MDVNECQWCGCEDIYKEFEFGQSASFACNHCGKRTVSGGVVELEEAEFQKTQCPGCKTSNNRTIRGPRHYPDRVVRHHWCETCQRKFKSVEQKETA